jgi:SAM-dependent methyltransferase
MLTSSVPWQTNKLGNHFVVVAGSRDDPESTEDVRSLPAERWARGKGLDSRLAWADHMRNVALAMELRSLEPLVVLEVGCGARHPMGVMIAGMELDTHYLGLDVNRPFALNVLNTKFRRPAVGIAHDASEGLPLVDECVDYCLCLEAMEHFCTRYADVEAFFGEVERVLRPGGNFVLATPVPAGEVLMHPHCHEHEFPPEVITLATRTAGLELDTVFNYRARPETFDTVPYEHLEFWAHPAAIDAFLLPAATRDRLVPGNAIYDMRKP